MTLAKNRIKKIIAQFQNKNILVVGDLILDRHIFGKVSRISPEAPVPVVWAKKETFRAGGAANVAANLSSLGARVSLCGATGNDPHGNRLKSILKKEKIKTKYIFENKKIKTTLKTRVIAHNQQVVRVDWESIRQHPKILTQSILQAIKKKIDDFDALIIEDYGKGLINPLLVKKLVQLCRERKKIITVDPKEDHFSYYQQVTALTPNLAEAESAAGMKAKNKTQIKKIGEKVLKKINPQMLLLTLGEKGMMLFEKEKTQSIPTAAMEVYDVTGAGDTVISAFTLSLLGKASSLEAAQIANLAAGIAVKQLGAAKITKNELIEKANEKKRN